MKRKGKSTTVSRVLVLLAVLPGCGGRAEADANEQTPPQTGGSGGTLAESDGATDGSAESGQGEHAWTGCACDNEVIACSEQPVAVVEEVTFVIGAQQDGGCEATLENFHEQYYAFDCVNKELCFGAGQCVPIGGGE
jgi:hypothetical protein